MGLLSASEHPLPLRPEGLMSWIIPQRDHAVPPGHHCCLFLLPEKPISAYLNYRNSLKPSSNVPFLSDSPLDNFLRQALSSPWDKRLKLGDVNKPLQDPTASTSADLQVLGCITPTSPAWSPHLSSLHSTRGAGSSLLVSSLEILIYRAKTGTRQYMFRVFHSNRVAS